MEVQIVLHLGLSCCTAELSPSVSLNKHENEIIHCLSENRSLQAIVMV